MNQPPSPEVANLEECLFELEAAALGYIETRRQYDEGEIGHNALHAALQDLRVGGENVRAARRDLAKHLAHATRDAEFSRLDAALGERADVLQLKARLENLGFSDDFGLS